MAFRLARSICCGIPHTIRQKENARYVPAMWYCRLPQRPKIRPLRSTTYFQSVFYGPDQPTHPKVWFQDLAPEEEKLQFEHRSFPYFRRDALETPWCCSL